MRHAVGVGLGWVAAVAALVCFGLGIVTVHRGREVRRGTEAIAADIASSNHVIDAVDLNAVGRVRGQLDQLAAVLLRLRQATGSETDVVLATHAEVERLVSVTGDDLGVAQSLRSTAAALSGRTAALAEEAGLLESGNGEVAARLRRIEGQLVSINVELAALERKLALLPALGG